MVLISRARAPVMTSQPPIPAAGLGPGSVPPPSQRIAVVVNGNAKNVTKEVIETLDQILLGGDLFVSRKMDEVAQIARTIAERGYGTVLTGGGDGTFMVVVSEVVRACRRRGRTPPRFGLLRLGTGNSLAWVIGASKVKGRGLAADIQRLREDAGSRPMRLIEVDGVLAPFCGFGIDARVLEDKEATKRWMLEVPLLRRFTSGELIYLVSSLSRTLPAYAFHPIPHCRVINEGADAYLIGYNGREVGSPIPKGSVVFEGKARIAAVSTIPYYGFGFRVFPYADERSDRMNLRLSTITIPQFVSNFASIWRGELQDPRIITDFLVEDVCIEFDPPTPFQIGGDPVGEKKSVRVQLSKEPIELVDFYAPPSS
jgi:diacylglycerol kinase family enzyme